MKGEMTANQEFSIGFVCPFCDFETVKIDELQEHLLKCNHKENK